MSNHQQGFTLLEITVVVLIISLLAAIVLANYRGGEKQSALLRSTHRLAQDLRRAEEMAMSSRKVPSKLDPEGIGVFPKGGYGIHFEIDTDPETPEEYYIILFADCDGGNEYNSWGSYTCKDADFDKGKFCDEKLEELLLEEGIKIKKLQVDSFPVDFLPITFAPPDPIVTIAGGDETVAVITLCLEDNPTITRTITVNKAGLIDTH